MEESQQPGEVPLPPEEVPESIVPRPPTGNLEASKEHSINRSETRKSTTHSTNASSLTMDSRDLLKAFRLIGGQNGIDEDELFRALSYQGSEARKLLQGDVHDFFAARPDTSVPLDFDEFTELVNDHTLLEQAIYKFLEKSKQSLQESSHDEVTGIEVRLESAVLVLIFLNAIMSGLSADVMPGWIGWQYIELCFVIFFLIEIALKVRRRIVQERNNCFTGLQKYLSAPGDLFDFVVTLIAVLAVVITLVGSSEASTVHRVTLLRLARVARAIKLLKFLQRYKEVALLMMGILAGFKTLMASFGLVMFFIFIMAIHVRGLIVDAENFDIDETDAVVLHETFPDMPMTCLVIFRCLVIGADAACVTPVGESIFASFSHHLGLSFSIPWVLIELILIFGVLNMVSAAFVMQAQETHQKNMFMTGQQRLRDDEEIMDKLDSMLRNLLHPKRKGDNEKLKNAGQIIDLIQARHPEVANKIEDFPQQMVMFAQQIPESQKGYAQAFSEYEFKEVAHCKELESLPHSSLHSVGGNEYLIVSVSSDSEQGQEKVRSKLMTLLGAGRWEVGVTPATLMQQESNLEKLLQEAEEVQSKIKRLILPGTAWANTRCAGKSGPIWEKGRMKICDEAIDPGVKNIERITEKTMSKYEGRFEHNWDYSRLGLIYDTVEHLLKGLKNLLTEKLAPKKDIEVVWVSNGFFEPTPLGWRDVKVMMRVRTSTGNRHIMEAQLQLRSMAQVRDGAHDFYAKIRGQLPPTVVSKIIDALTEDSTLDLGMRENEWLESLGNVQVQALLDKLEVPKEVRMHIFEVLDSDNSGVVTSSQLREGLLRCKAPARSMDLVDCKLTTHDIQTRLQVDINPKLIKLAHAVEKMASQPGSKAFQMPSTSPPQGSQPTETEVLKLQQGQVRLESQMHQLHQQMEQNQQGQARIEKQIQQLLQLAGGRLGESEG